MRTVTSRAIRQAVLPAALLGLFAAGCARLGHHGVQAPRPGGANAPQHIATRGTIPPAFLDLVTTKKAFANLATVMPNGGPQVTPVWFDFDGKYIRVNSARGRVKDKNMRRDPRVALSILDPDNPYRYLSILRQNHRRRRGRAHQRARQEVPRHGHLPQSPARRSARHVRHRAPAGGGARVNRAPVQYVPRLFTFCRLIPSQRTTVWAGTILFALVVLSADMARAAGSKCTAAKYNAAGQRVADEAKCFGKAVKKGGGVDSACLLKAEGMFASLFMKAESHADCLAPKGDAGTVAATVDAFVEDIGRTVTGSAGGAFVASKCNAKKIEAVGTTAGAKAKCESKAARKGAAVAPGCLSNADGKFGHAIGKAEGKGDCTQKGQRATLEAKVGAFMDALMSQLQPTGSVTTTTTRTARTTTTTTSATHICCHFASGGTCDWAPSAEACSRNEVPGTPGASGSVCNGATGTCTSPPASAGPCCSGVTAFFSNACSGGPGETASVCSAEGGTLSTGVCHPSGACVP